MSNLGIREKYHVARRIFKAEKIATRLGQIGARFKSLPVKVSFFLSISNLCASWARGIMRTVLLWILGKWICFALRHCHKCSTHFQSQAHVIDCINLAQRLVGHPGLTALSVS